MNIFRKEIMGGIKAFIIWCLGILFLMLEGLMEFNSASTTEGGMSAMLVNFPKPVLAMFGMAEADLNTLGGYVSVLQFYAILAICCYAVGLAMKAVMRESIDKTDEFLFTKPCSRLHILSMKLLSGTFYITLICIVNGALLLFIPNAFGIANNIKSEMLLFSLSVYLVALFMFALTAMIAVLAKKAERATQFAYGSLIFFYALSIMFDMNEKWEFVRFATPLKYFRASEMLQGTLCVPYLIVILALTCICFVITGYLFRKKDMLSV